MAEPQTLDDSRVRSATTQQRWILRGEARTGLPEIPRVELWAHHRGPIGMLAIPRERLLIAPHLQPWLLHNLGQAAHVVTVRSAWESTESPGPLVPPHALPAASVLSPADFDQAYDVGRRNAHMLGLDPVGAHHNAANHERALAYARGVVDELQQARFSTSATDDPASSRRAGGTPS